MEMEGISNSDRIVIYSNKGLIYASRLYWTLKYFGQKNVAIVDGGKNIINKKDLVITKTKIKSSKYSAKINPKIIVDSDYVLRSEEHTSELQSH